MDDELKILIPAVADQSGGAKKAFEASLNSLASASKVEITVSKINGKQAINTFKKEIEAVFGSVGSGSSASVVNKKDFQKLKELQTLKNKLNKQFEKTDNSDLLKRAELSRQIVNVTKESDLLTQKSKLTQKQNNTLLEMGIKAQKELSIIQAKNQDKQTKNAKETYNSLLKIKETGQIGKDVTNAKTDINKFKELGKDVKKLDDALLKVESAALRFNNAIDAKDVTKAKSEYKEYEKAIKSVKSSLSSLGKEKSAETTFNKDTSSLRNLILEMQRFERANDQLRNKKNKGFASEFDGIFGGVEKAIANKDITGVNTFIQQWKLLQKEMNDAGVVGQRFTTKLKSQFEKFGAYLSASGILFGVVTQIKSMITNVIELDSAMTELKKVTDETSGSYSRFLQNAEIRAKTIGATLTDTIKATADFARIGLSLKDAEKVADTALMYKNVESEIGDIGEASKSIISTMKANACLYVQKCA